MGREPFPGGRGPRARVAPPFVRPGAGPAEGFDLRRVFAEWAVPDDAPALADLERAGVAAWDRRAFERELRGGSSRVLVLKAPAAHEEPGLVAYCAFRAMADEMEVLGLAVEPGWRRQGLGRWLVGLALWTGAREGARTAFLEVRPSNLSAIALYERLGFREAGRRPRYYHGPVEDALVLARSLR